MSMSVEGTPGRKCQVRISVPCPIRVSGQCAYYGSDRIPGPEINTGDVYDTVIIKLVNYINNAVAAPASVIPIVSNDFEVDGITCNLPSLAGRNFELFFNDLNRFIYNEVGNQEWDYVVGGGFKVLLPGFDANSSSYHLYLFPKT